MTRKDYVLIADTIAQLSRDIAMDHEALTERGQAILIGEQMSVHSIAYRLADQLHHDNNRFDRQRFIDACQLDAERLA